MEFDPSKIVASGTWLYDGTVPCRVVILEEDVWPAFFDPEDDPDADDKEMPCVSVWYESTGGSFSAGGGYYHTLQEAKDAVESILPGLVDWGRVEGMADDPDFLR